MTYEELIKAVSQLSREDRLSLREEISTTLDEVMKSAAAKSPPDLRPDGRVIGVFKRGNGESSLSQTLYGILQFETGPPTDAEVKDMIADYLLKKYY